MNVDIMYHYMIHLPLCSYKEPNNARTLAQNKSNEIRELRSLLTDLLTGRWKIPQNIYYEKGFWYCNVYVEHKEDVARIKLFRDCVVIDGRFL